jgi:hypothetical protein
MFCSALANRWQNDTLQRTPVTASQENAEFQKGSHFPANLQNFT